MLSEEAILRPPSAMLAKSSVREPATPRSVASTRMVRDSSMEDPDGVLASVAQCIEQLRGAAVSQQDKEKASKKLLELVEKKHQNAKQAITTHTQAIPLLVSVLRTGTVSAKINVAAIIALLCEEDELRMKVLLGGCVPPLLALLKLGSQQAHTAAARAIHAVTSTVDHVGAKIFSTEAVVPSLWEQFAPGNKLETGVLGLLTGALRNLCNIVDGFWPSTLEAGGVQVLVALLSTNNSDAQANSCSILKSLMMAVESSGSRVFAAGATDQLFRLMEPVYETPVRAESAGALRALTLRCPAARQSISSSSSHLVSCLVRAVVAPSKEYLEGVNAQQLQENAMGALSNVLGGMDTVVSCLSDDLQHRLAAGNAPEHDTVGALAYALMVIESKDDEEGNITESALTLERLLVKLMSKEHQDDMLLEEHAIEALASLYGNAYLATKIDHAEAKKMLVGMATMADPWVRGELVKSIASLCSGKAGLWESIRGRDGVQFMISLLGVSSEQQQEHAAALLSILSKQVEESNWAITASGGIPPLVQLLETGSAKAKQDAAVVLGNLCSHSEDIRACVETAQAETALLWLLKNTGTEGQEIAATAIVKLVRTPNAKTLSQLTAMLVGELPSSKQHVLDVMEFLLALVSLDLMSKEEEASYEAFDTLISLLGADDSTSTKATQEKATSVVADLLRLRADMHASPLVRKAVGPLNKLLHKQDESTRDIYVAAQASRALGALFSSIKSVDYVKDAASNAIGALVTLSKTSNLAASEAAVEAFANLLLDEEVALKVPFGDMIIPISVVLRDGSVMGRENAAAALARFFLVHSLDLNLVEAIRSSGTVSALANLLSTVKFEDAKSSQALEALLALARRSRSSVPGASCFQELVKVVAKQQDCVAPLVICASVSQPVLCDKAIEVLARLCQEEEQALVSNLMASTGGFTPAVAQRVILSPSIDVKIGGTSLIVCAARKHGEKVIGALADPGCVSSLIQTLVSMLGNSGDGDADDGRGIIVSLWLLSLIAAHAAGLKKTIMEAGAIDISADRLAIFAPNARQAKVEESGSNWISAMLLAILFQDREVSRSNATLRAVPSLSLLLKSEETSDRYFAAQALASLVCHGTRGTLLAVANSGAVGGLISLLGSSGVEADSLVSLSEEFFLVPSPEQVALERLFRVDDIKFGSTARKAIPSLVDLLKPIPGRPGAAPLALSLLTQVAEANDQNKMGEAGVLDALTKYLSLGPQDAIEEAAAELLRILFTCPELRKHESAHGAVEQLIAVLRLGARRSRYTAARALQEVFAAEHIRGADFANQAIIPLVEMLGSAVEREQRAAIGALVALAADNPHKANVIGDSELSTMEVLSKILSADNSSIQLKEHAAELCVVLFANARARSKGTASSCIPPLIDLLNSETESVQLVAARALDNILDDEQQAEAVAAYAAVVPLVELIVGSSFDLHEVAVSALIKLGKDRPLCKLDMVKAEVIEKILDCLTQPESPNTFCALSAELLRILTNNSSIARSASAAKVVEPFFFALTTRGDGLEAAGQQSIIQTLINIIEKPQCAAMQNLSCEQALQPLVQLLGSSSPLVQQVAAELLSHLLSEPRFQLDGTTPTAIPALVKLVSGSSGSLSVQQRAINALELAANGRADTLAELGGVAEVSKIITQTDPPAPHALWESAANLLASFLQWSTGVGVNPQQFCNPSAIARLLKSTNEATVSTAIHALLVVEKEDAQTAEVMAESGAIEALVEVLRSHQCEEAAARLLETLVNNVKVRSMKSSKLAICPLSEFLLDPQTQSEQARLLATLALGDLFQNDQLCKSNDAASACRALVSVLEGQHTEELQMVAIGALENLLANGRGNKRAFAEAGGVQALQDLVATASPEAAAHAASLLKVLFNNFNNHEFVNIELVQALLSLLEKDMWAREPVKDDIVKSINMLFSNYPKFRVSETATTSIPLLIAAMKAESEVAQEAALDTLCLFVQTWHAIPEEESKIQANAMAEAIPILQMMVRNGAQRLHERIEFLLQNLPGNLLVHIKRGNNLRQSMGGTNAFCKVTLGNHPPRQTKVIANNSAPQWEQGFAWAFDIPPNGQKLRISCKNKGAFGKASLGKVTIQIDKVIMLGTLAGEYQIKPEHNPSRTLEIEFQWSNR